MLPKVETCPYTIDGTGPAMFLIHGIGASRIAWSNLVPILRNHFTVISYDLRGHGSASLPGKELGLEDLVDDLEQIRCEANIDRAHFVGHSLGGMIGPAYARKCPERVISLGLLSTAAFRTSEDSSKVWKVVRAMESKGIPQILETLTDRWFTDEFIQSQPEVVENRLNQVIATNPEVFLNVFRIYAGTEMKPWLHEIECPCLVLTGENDGGCNPRLNRQIASAIANSELVILPDLKHSILLEAGEKVAQEIIRFCNRVS